MTTTLHQSYSEIENCSEGLHDWCEIGALQIADSNLYNVIKSDMATMSAMCSANQKSCVCGALTAFYDDLLLSLRSCEVTFLFCQRHSTPAKYSKQLAATSHCPFSKNERKSNHPTKVHTQTLGKQVLLDHTPLLSFS